MLDAAVRNRAVGKAGGGRAYEFGEPLPLPAHVLLKPSDHLLLTGDGRQRRRLEIACVSQVLGTHVSEGCTRAAHPTFNPGRMHSGTPVSVLLHAAEQETVAPAGTDERRRPRRRQPRPCRSAADPAHRSDHGCTPTSPRTPKTPPAFPLSPPGAHRLIQGAETPRSATWGLSRKVTDAIDRTECIARFGVRAVGGGQLPGADAAGLPGPPVGAPLGGAPVGAPLGGPPPSGAPPPPPGALPPVGSVLVSMGTVSFAV